jgi:hypothetical protein
MKYHWLVLSIAAGAVGFFVCRALGLSEPATVTITSVLAFLASYPSVKYGTSKVGFLPWVTAAALSVIFGWALYFGFQRLGG